MLSCKLRKQIVDTSFFSCPQQYVFLVKTNELFESTFLIMIRHGCLNLLNSMLIFKITNSKIKIIITISMLVAIWSFVFRLHTFQLKEKSHILDHIPHFFREHIEFLNVVMMITFWVFPKGLSPMEFRHFQLIFLMRTWGFVTSQFYFFIIIHNTTKKIT